MEFNRNPSSRGGLDLFSNSGGNSRLNYLNELRENFTKFENEVWNYNSLCPDEAFKIDFQLPHLLIETFAKLFRLWRDYDAFQKLLKAELFHEINEDMNAYFRTSDLSQFNFYCDTCDRNIPVQRNDLKYSYELHTKMDHHHQEVLNNLNYVNCPSTRNEVQFQNSFNDTSTKTEGDLNGHIILTENNRLKCSLCDKLLIDEQEAIHHVISWSHRLKEISFNAEDTNYIVEINGKYYCRLCRCKVTDKKQYHADHLVNKTHQMMEECRKILKESDGLVKLLNEDLGEFICEPCGVNGVNWNDLLEHCRSLDHVDRQNVVCPFDDNDFIRFSNDHYECFLCQRTLERWEIVEHKRNEEHMEKHLAILNGNGSVPNYSSLLDSSSESDGYNDAFKNNDIYIEITLRDDDSEIFKCVLCNETGRGLDNLDTHCLTPTHQNHKKHIERVSRVFATSDGNDEPVCAIKDLDDLYYCQVCDVLIEDEMTVSQHTMEKKHIQSELVQKILDENGACISLLTEEPTKSYYCQLCSRLIDGDDNIVGHGNSSRHTQLLNIVKELTRNRLL